VKLTPSLRKITLIIHVCSSVGWFGAIACFLVLAFVGLIQSEHSVYLAMGLITDLIIVPFCLFAIGSGLVLALGTEWGLFRHYWVLIKFILIVLSALVLLIHLQPIHEMAGWSASHSANATYGIQVQLVVASGAALLVLMLVTILSMIKPSGLTPYGW
jgi:hypothetical protein